MTDIGFSSAESTNQLEPRQEIPSISETGTIDNVLIFLNITFLPGVEQSINRFQTIMSGRGFRVRIHLNKTAEEISNLITQIFQSSHQHSQSLWLVFCGNGTESYVLGTDGHPFHVRTIFELFNPNHHPSLDRKPKLILVDTHKRGLQYSVPEAKECPSKDGFLMFCSTSPEMSHFYSEGSLFITSLSNSLEDEQPKLAVIWMRAVAKQLKEEGVETCITDHHLHGRYYI